MLYVTTKVNFRYYIRSTKHTLSIQSIRTLENSSKTKSIKISKYSSIEIRLWLLKVASKFPEQDNDHVRSISLRRETDNLRIIIDPKFIANSSESNCVCVVILIAHSYSLSSFFCSFLLVLFYL